MKKCNNCGKEVTYSKYCAADVCDNCSNHNGLARCYCGWSITGGNGRKELEEMGETIDEE